MALRLTSGVLSDPGDPVFKAGGLTSHYRPTDVGILFGAHPLHIGIADGTFISAQRNKPTWRGVKGCDGEGIRIRTNDFSGTVTLTLRQGSAANDFLSAFALADEISGVLAPPITVGHINGRSVAVGLFASVEKPADLNFGVQETDTVWTFICDTWQSIAGGFNSYIATAS